MGVNIKSETVKLLVENMTENLSISGIVKDFLDDPNSVNQKQNLINYTSTKFKVSAYQKTLLRKWKDESQTGINYLQYICGWFSFMNSEFANSSY